MGCSMRLCVKCVAVYRVTTKSTSPFCQLRNVVICFGDQDGKMLKGSTTCQWRKDVFHCNLSRYCIDTSAEDAVVAQYLSTYLLRKSFDFLMMMISSVPSKRRMCAIAHYSHPLSAQQMYTTVYLKNIYSKLWKMRITSIKSETLGQSYIFTGWSGYESSCAYECWWQNRFFILPQQLSLGESEPFRRHIHWVFQPFLDFFFF